MAEKTTGNWMEYDWFAEQAPARFGVELSLASERPAGRGMLLCVTMGMANGGDVTARGERHMRRLQTKLEKTLLPVLAGIVDTDRERTLYYYIGARQRLSTAEELLGKDKLLACAFSCRQEEEWQTYHALLYPDAAKLYTIENGRRIELLKKHGDRAELSRRMTLHLFFPSEPLLLQFMEQARLAGFAVGEQESVPEQELPYGVMLHRISTLQKHEIDGLTTCAIRIAEQYGGQLLYWECPIMSKTWK